MLIKSIKAKKFKINDKISLHIILKTSHGKFKSKLSLNSNSFYSKEQLQNDVDFVNKILKEKIKNLEINSFDDIKKLENLIKQQDKKILRKSLFVIEQSILKALSKDEFWKFINPAIKTIPRPLGIIFGRSDIKQSCDFKQILIFSLENNNFNKAIEANSRVHELLEREIKKYDKDFKGEINLQGALVANISNFDILDIISRVCKQVSDEFKFNLNIGINFDSDSIHNDDHYHYKNFSGSEKEKSLNKKEQIAYIINLVKRYNLFYIEDPLEKDNFNGYKQLKKKVNCLIIGNKLINSKIENLNLAIKDNCINAFVLKLNDIGSLMEAKSLIDLANKNNIRLIAETSDHETDENFLVHFAIAFNIPVIKYGIYKKDKEKIDLINKIQSIMKNK
ncbi:hypothetical protein HYX18_00215 [Candidatus Woesearchaeota archaeon]|nr:hypothetical protein [Candidatus Woesearchaeota archaeon]